MLISLQPFMPVLGAWVELRCTLQFSILKFFLSIWFFIPRFFSQIILRIPSCFLLPSSHASVSANSLLFFQQANACICAKFQIANASSSCPPRLVLSLHVRCFSSFCCNFQCQPSELSLLCFLEPPNIIGIFPYFPPCTSRNDSRPTMKPRTVLVINK